MCNVWVIRSLALYLAAACYGVALGQDLAPVAVPTVPGEAFATPLGFVLTAAILRGWTPTVRVIHARESD